MQLRLQVLLAESAKGEQMSAIEAQKMIADHARDMDELRTDSDRRISKLQVRFETLTDRGQTMNLFSDSGIRIRR